jgi:hypothetical protein
MGFSANALTTNTKQSILLMLVICIMKPQGVCFFSNVPCIRGLQLIVLTCERHLYGEHKMVMKNVLFWDVMPCGSCKNRRFRGTYHLHHQGEKNQQARNNVSSN